MAGRTLLSLIVLWAVCGVCYGEPIHYRGSGEGTFTVGYGYTIGDRTYNGGVDSKTHYFELPVQVSLDVTFDLDTLTLTYQAIEYVTPAVDFQWEVLVGNRRPALYGLGWIEPAPEWTGQLMQVRIPATTINVPGFQRTIFSRNGEWRFEGSPGSAEVTLPVDYTIPIEYLFADTWGTAALGPGFASCVPWLAAEFYPELLAVPAPNIYSQQRTAVGPAELGEYDVSPYISAHCRAARDIIVRPVPEPSSLVMFLVFGCSIVGLFHRLHQPQRD